MFSANTTNSTVFISGDVTLDCSVNFSRASIVVLPGATLTITGFSTGGSYEDGQTIIDVKEGGTINFQGGFQFYNANYKWGYVSDIINAGTINVGKGTNTSYSIKAIDFYNTSTSKDNDGDGVPNDTDQFPNDPTLAYVSYFPSEGTFCTYAFEDLWSDIGDYDLNDLVIYCNVGYYKNANNMVVYEKVKWKLMAAGTSMLLSCGVQLDGVSTSEVSSVTNTNTALAAGPIGHSESNGCESGQTYAVFPLLNSPSELFGVNTFVNTGYTGGSVVAPVEKETKVTFTTPLDPTRLGMDAFNLFIAVSKNFDATYRGREVHLMTFDATDLIDPNLLKYDPTNPQDWKSDDNPYRLRNGLVWAIMIPTEFHWARETIDVASIYTNYINWYSTSAADAQYWYDTSVSTNVSNYNWLYN
jgi:LruC domain-containing protein